MGKKNKKNKRKANKKLVKPDEYYQYGPIEMARFGKEVVLRNNIPEDKFDDFQKSLADQLPSISEKIDGIIQEISAIVSALPPLELLKQAHWKHTGTTLGLYGDAGDRDGALALRMVDYLQSIIASTPPAEKRIKTVDQETFAKLESLVNGLFQEMGSYFISRSAHERNTNPDYEPGYDKFYTSAQMHWCMVRGDRYQAHEIAHHTAILAPHDEVLQELFGVTTSELVNGVQAILTTMMSGIQTSCSDMKEFQKVTTDALKKRIEEHNEPEKDIRDIMQEVIQENDWEDWQYDVLGRFGGYDLHDLKKITDLPSEFLAAFSWEQGENTEFFSGDEMQGWPLKVWPIFQRPFLKVDGDYYCFECHSLLDNLYRQIQRQIFDRKPEYKPIWAQKQQEISEDLPITFFEKILPGATIYKSVYYQWPKKNQWVESDIIVAYEDHLFIIEVKAGSFTYSSPATDFSAYIDSLKNLVYKPAKQGMRFLKYLNSKPTVSLFNRNHEEIGTLSADDFNYHNVCALTLDSFTEIACQPKQLKGLGIDLGEHPIWAFSIDDLRVYADIFTNPLVFLHYAEQRSRAFHTEHMSLNDELDHLGLYLAHNIYTEKPLSMLGSGMIRYHGFSSKVDDFYSAKLQDPDTPAPLKQDMPRRLDEIINMLASGMKPERRKAASMLLDCGGEWRDNISASIDSVLKRQLKRGTIQPISTIGETKISIVCWDPRVSEPINGFGHDHSYATMLISEDEERTSFELFFNENQELVDISFYHLKITDIAQQDRERLEKMAIDIKMQRWGKAHQSGKIGRNQSCPCGSGKKYKKCCGK